MATDGHGMRGAPRAGIILVMARISTDEVTRVAGLARIALTPEEITRIAGELDVITEAVAKVGCNPGCARDLAPHSTVECVA